MYDKYRTLESLRDAHPKCPVCQCDIDYYIENSDAGRRGPSATKYYHRPQPTCGQHYSMSYRPYRYGGQTYFRPLSETMLFGDVLLYFGHRWKTEKTLKVKLLVIKDEIKKHKFGEQWVHYSDQQNHFRKVFTLNRFKKLYKWDDRPAFLAKLSKLQKALIFT